MSLSLVPQAPELITAFDEHRVSPNFKFGILYQKDGQVRNYIENAPHLYKLLKYGTVMIHSFSANIRLFLVHGGGHTK